MTYYDSGGYERKREIVGLVRRCEGECFSVDVNGALDHLGLNEVYTTVFYRTKQQCWDYIARNYPNQGFHWNV